MKWIVKQLTICSYTPEWYLYYLFLIPAREFGQFATSSLRDHQSSPGNSWQFQAPKYLWNNINFIFLWLGIIRICPFLFVLNWHHHYLALLTWRCIQEQVNLIKSYLDNWFVYFRNLPWGKFVSKHFSCLVYQIEWSLQHLFLIHDNLLDILREEGLSTQTP